MRFSELKSDDENQIASSHRDHHSASQCHTLQQDKPSPAAQFMYAEIVKAIGNNDKRLFKRASWSPSILQERGLPPTGKRTDNEPSAAQRNPNRVRMRPKVARYYQPLPPPQQKSLVRPISFNEKYDHHLVDHQQGKLLNPSVVSYFEQ